jgi:hypothetical protein
MERKAITMNACKFLITAAALIATLAPAKAAEPTMPIEYRGDWCFTGRPHMTERKHVPPAECFTVIKLTATKMQFADGALASEEDEDKLKQICKLKKIKHLIIGKVNLPEGLFICEDGKKIPFVFTTGSGSLGYLARRLYIRDEAEGLIK